MEERKSCELWNPFVCARASYHNIITSIYCPQRQQNCSTPFACLYLGLVLTNLHTGKLKLNISTRMKARRRREMLKEGKTQQRVNDWSKHKSSQTYRRVIFAECLFSDRQCIVKQVGSLFILVLISVKADTDGREKTCSIQPKCLLSVNYTEKHLDCEVCLICGTFHLNETMIWRYKQPNWSQQSTLLRNAWITNIVEH